MPRAYSPRKKTEPRKYCSVFLDMQIRLDSPEITDAQLEKLIENLRKYSRKAAYDSGVRARLVVVKAEVGEAEVVPEHHPEKELV
jgi:hypothetical protein